MEQTGDQEERLILFGSMAQVYDLKEHFMTQSSGDKKQELAKYWHSLPGTFNVGPLWRVH